MASADLQANAEVIELLEEVRQELLEPGCITVEDLRIAVDGKLRRAQMKLAQRE